MGVSKLQPHASKEAYLVGDPHDERAERQVLLWLAAGPHGLHCPVDLSHDTQIPLQALLQLSHITVLGSGQDFQCRLHQRSCLGHHGHVHKDEAMLVRASRELAD